MKISQSLFLSPPKMAKARNHEEQMKVNPAPVLNREIPNPKSSKSKASFRLDVKRKIPKRRTCVEKSEELLKSPNPKEAKHAKNREERRKRKSVIKEKREKSKGIKRTRKRVQRKAERLESVCKREC